MIGVNMINKLFTIVDTGHDGVEHMTDNFGMFGIWWWMWLLMFVFMVVFVYLIAWTYQDATKRSDNAVFWSLIVFFTMGFGMLVYLAVRTPDEDKNRAKDKFRASSEQQHIPKGIIYCETCGVPMTVEDKFCSSCGKSTT